MSNHRENSGQTFLERIPGSCEFTEVTVTQKKHEIDGYYRCPKVSMKIPQEQSLSDSGTMQSKAEAGATQIEIQRNQQ